jgi:hypothetical protein
MAVAVATESQRRVIASAIVASSTVTVACTNDNGHPRNGHNVDDLLHNWHDKVIVDNVLPLLLCLSNNDEGNAFPLMQLAEEVALSLLLLLLLLTLLLCAPLSIE